MFFFATKISSSMWNTICHHILPVIYRCTSNISFYLWYTGAPGIYHFTIWLSWYFILSMYSLKKDLKLIQIETLSKMALRLCVIYSLGIMYRKCVPMDIQCQTVVKYQIHKYPQTVFSCYLPQIMIVLFWWIPNLAPLPTPNFFIITSLNTTYIFVRLSFTNFRDFRHIC